MSNIDINDLIQEFAANSNMQDIPQKTDFLGITLGVVVDTDDPLEQGRLRVFCPRLGDDPKKVIHIPWCTYMSPFTGSVNSSSFTRGGGDEPSISRGEVHYGFWGIPELGAHVYVTCVDGDYRRRVWIGASPQHQATHTQNTGRWIWRDNGAVDGPLTSDGTPLEPLHTNNLEAFEGDNKSREWKTRIADYQICSVPKDKGPPSSDKGKYSDQQYQDIAAAEEDAWVKPILGSHGYDWTAFKSVGAHKASRVVGLSTPGNHSLTMDDRHFNSRVKLRTSSGHQILLDDTNERIYISTNKGASYVEMDSSGNVDIYTKRRLSVRSEEDINLSSEKTVRIKGKTGVHLYAGDTRGQDSLENTPIPDGQIRFHSTDDLHIFVEKTMRQLIKNDLLTEVGKDLAQSIGKRMYTQVEEGIDTIVNEGDSNTSVNGSVHMVATLDTSVFSGGNNIIQAINDTEIFSFEGKMDLGSQTEMSIKSYDADISMEAKSEDGAIKMSSCDGDNRIEMTKDQIMFASNNEISNMSKVKVSNVISPDFDVANMLSGSGCLPITAVEIEFTGNDIKLKSPTSISFNSNAVETSIETINSSLQQIENRFNKAVFEIQATFLAIELSPFGFPVPALSADFPSLSIDLLLPAINLPQFNFPNFCLDFSRLVTLKNFNMLPDLKFFEVNANLTNWTVSNLQSWGRRNKRNFDNMIDSVTSASSFPGLDSNVAALTSAFQQISNSLDSLIDINVTSNSGIILQYQAGVNSLTGAASSYNAAIVSQGLTGSVPSLNQIENQSIMHSNNLDLIFDGKDLTVMDGQSFAGLSDYAAQVAAVISGLGDI